MSARSGPWIWGRTADVSAFVAPVVAAFALSFLAPRLAPQGGLPPWAYVGLVVFVDVAHVHTMLFRTYFDGEELARRPLLYASVPCVAYALGALLYAQSAAWFWRTLAYVAVFHFVRQQAGWVAIYRARAAESSRTARFLDDAVIYAATGFPLLYWHVSSPRSFHWFVDGDFFSAPSWAPLLVPAGILYGVLLTAYVVHALRGPANPGKHMVVATTALTWLGGIVLFDSDLAFTATNVLAHGIPYFVLLFVYAKGRARGRPRALLTHILRYGVLGFLASVVFIAFVEEALWDHLVWHDNAWIFGSWDDVAFSSTFPLAWIVPLLAVPQATHYVLDAVLWRRKDTGPAQALALGFPSSP